MSLAKLLFTIFPSPELWTRLRTSAPFSGAAVGKVPELPLGFSLCALPSMVPLAWQGLGLLPG